MLTRFDQFRDIDRLFSQLVSNATDSSTKAMPLDIARGHDHYLVQADLPGVRPDSIDISVEGNVLSIRAERSSTPMDDMRQITNERPTGQFIRQLSLGEGFDMDRVTASYNDGVLTIKLPVAEAVKPKRISVAVGTNSTETNNTSQLETST